jgi:carboxymethylenebutenolidase
MMSLNVIDATEQNVRGAVQYLRRNGAKVGIAGFSSGAVAIIGAAKIPELVAAVSFYGKDSSGEAAKPADVKIPLQAHFANHDDFITPEVVDDFKKALEADAEFFRYDAHHAFVNEQRMAVHDRYAAELAWSGATSFLRKHLGEAESRAAAGLKRIRWSLVSKARSFSSPAGRRALASPAPWPSPPSARGCP